MDNKDIKKLSEITGKIKTINKKFKLLKLLNLAHAEYEKNNYENCLEACKKVLNTDYKNPVALRGIGCVMQSMGNYKEALEYYKKALTYSKNKEIEYTLIGTIYYLQDNYEPALEYYNLALQCNDNYDPAYDGRNQTILEKHLQIADLQDELIRRNIF